MEDFEDDPLDLLEDDGDGVIETILLLDDEEEKEKPILERTGCAVLLIGVSSTVGAGWWCISKFLI